MGIGRLDEILMGIERIEKKLNPNLNQDKKYPLALLNTTILTNNGSYSLKPISTCTAQRIFNANKDNFISAIGHDSTTEILNKLLETDLIETNRIQFRQEIGQTCICFKLKGRPEEGKILSLDEIYQIGFEFKLLERID